MQYKQSGDFQYLQKLSDLEKILDTHAIAGKTKDTINRNLAPVKDIVDARARIRVPLEDLNAAIDSGIEEFAGHVHARKIVLKPQEAMYVSIGEKDKALYNLLDNITLTDIIKMIKNKAAVSQFPCPTPMSIGRNDIPKHISRIMMIRSNSPRVLFKQAKDSNIAESYRVTMHGGDDIVLGQKFIDENHERVKSLITDGTIIKMVKLYSNGKESDSLVKKAMVDIDDMLYLSLVCQI